MSVSLKTLNGSMDVPSIVINNISNGFVTAQNGAISSIPSIGNDNLNNALSERLNTMESNIQTLQSGSSSSGSDVDISVDDTVPMMEALASSNISNFAANWSLLNNSPTDNGVGIGCSYNGQYIIKLGWSAPSYLSRDFGNTWSVVSDLGSYQWACSMSASGKYILVTTIMGSSRLSSDYGATWTILYSYGTVNEGKVSPTGRYMVMASSDGIYYSSNYGQTFTKFTDSNTNSWSAVAISADGLTSVAIRASTPPTIWKTTNNGGSWSQIFNNPSSVSFGNISCSQDAKYILLGLSQGSNGNMYLSSDYGSSFTSVTGLSSGPYFKTAMSANGMYMVSAGNTGNVYISKNFGSSWQTSPLPSTYYYGICMSQDAKYIYAYLPNNKVYSFNANITSLSTEQPSNPGKGTMYYDESTNKLYVYNSVTSAWKSVTLA